MNIFDHIVEQGDRRYEQGAYKWDDSNRVLCADGFSFSMIAGPGAYCFPRPTPAPDIESIYHDRPHDYAGPYSEVEIVFPSARPEPWLCWAEYCENPASPEVSAYGYVPVELVSELISNHGGEQDSAIRFQAPNNSDF